MRILFAIAVLFSSLTLTTPVLAAPACSGDYLLEKTFPSGAKWQLCWEHRQREGIVYHDFYYTPPNGSERRILKQASIAQIHVPYDDNGARYHDVSDYGLGSGYLNDLQTDDCPSGQFRGENGKNMICTLSRQRNHAHAHHAATQDVHKIGQYFEFFSVSHIGAYNYIPTWRLYDDGTIEAVMGATGSLQRYRTGSQYQENGWLLNSTDKFGVSHLHNYYWRLDFDLGTDANDDVVDEIEFVNQAGNQSRLKSVTPFTTEVARSIAPDRYRSWQIRDGVNSNANGHVMSYQIEPLMTGHRDEGPSYEPWTHNDFYVTVNNSCEKYASHNPQVSGCTDNLSTFVNGESLVGSDLVVWYGLSFHHIPRDEDEPKMHAHWNSFKIVPRNMTANNPLADLSGSTNTAPVITNPGNQTSNRGETVSLALTASDIDGDSLSFSASGLPAGLSISSGGVISGIPSTAGSNTVTISVSDGTISDQEILVWTINATGSGVCSTYTSTHVPVAISASGSVTVTSKININQSGVITDLNVLNLKGSHSYMADLDFKLTSPAGTIIQIINNSCGSNNNFDLNLDDSGTTGWPCPPIGGGTYKPTTLLGAFNGQESAGEWILTIHDQANLDGGSLNQWAIEMCLDDNTPVNQPPVLTSPNTQISTEGDAVSLPINASDPDGDSLVFTASGLPSGLQINGASGIISGILAANSAGVYSVTVSVDDGNNHLESVVFGWQINAASVNQPPLLTSPGDQINTLGDFVSLTLAASDPEGDTLLFSASGLPNGLIINSTSGVISGTFVIEGVGSHTVSITVNDGQGHSVNANFNWQVNNASEVYQIQGVIGEYMSFNMATANTETCRQGFPGYPQVTGLPAGMYRSGCAIYGRPLISGTFRLTFPIVGGEWFADLVISGDGGTTNQAPTLNNPGNQSSSVDAVISLPLVASDPDGDGLAYSATGLPLGLQVNNTSGLISGTLVAGSIGSHSVTVTINDGNSHSVSVTFTWRVVDGDIPPSDVYQIQGVIGEFMSFSMIDVNDEICRQGLPDYPRVTGLPAGVYQSGCSIYGRPENAGTSRLIFPIIGGEWLADLVVSGGGTTNQPPVITNPGTQNNSIDEVISLAITASDVDGDDLIYSSNTLPQGLDIDSVTGNISGTLATESLGSHAVTITVIDGNDHTVSINFGWLVIDGDVPPPEVYQIQGVVGQYLVFRMTDVNSETCREGLPDYPRVTGLPAGMYRNGCTIYGRPQNTGTSRLTFPVVGGEWLADLVVTN